MGKVISGQGQEAGDLAQGCAVPPRVDACSPSGPHRQEEDRVLEAAWTGWDLDSCHDPVGAVQGCARPSSCFLQSLGMSSWDFLNPVPHCAAVGPQANTVASPGLSFSTCKMEKSFEGDADAGLSAPLSGHRGNGAPGANAVAGGWPAVAHGDWRVLLSFL